MATAEFAEEWAFVHVRSAWSSHLWQAAHVHRGERNPLLGWRSPEGLSTPYRFASRSEKDGYSEFSYYPFRSSAETGSEPTFQEWLDEFYKGRFFVREFPTTDSRKIPNSILEEIVQYLCPLLRSGGDVIVVDSAGAVRSSRVCEAMGCRRHSRQ